MAAKSLEEKGVEATHASDVEQELLNSAVKEQSADAVAVSIQADSHEVQPEHVTASSTKPLQQLQHKNRNVLFRHILVLGSLVWDSGPLSMSVAALTFAFSALFVKLIAGRVPVFEIVTFRSSLSFLACAWGARQADIKLFGRKANFPRLLARGIFGAAAMSTYYVSIDKLPLADAVTLFFTNPAVTSVAAALIMKEPLGWKGSSGVLVSLVGVVVLSQPPFLFSAGSQQWSRDRGIGTAFGLVSALCAAGAFICIRLIGHAEPPLVMSVYFHSCAFVSSVIPLAVGFPERAVLPSWIDFLLLLGVAGTSFWGQILVGRGFQLLRAAHAAAINTTQVVYSYLMGLILLHEHFNLWGILGSILIAAGVLLVSSRQKPPAASTASTNKHGSTAAGSGSKAGGSSELQSTQQHPQPGAEPPGVADALVVMVELPEMGADSVGKVTNQAAFGVLPGIHSGSGSEQHAEGDQEAPGNHSNDINTHERYQPNGHGCSEDASDIQGQVSESQALLEGECPSSPAMPQSRGVGKGAVLARLLGHMDSRVVVHQAGLWREQLRTQYDPDSPRLTRLHERR